VAVEFHVRCREIANLKQRRIPVHDCDRLVADGSRWQFAGPADDCRSSDAAFEKRAFVADPLAGVSAAAVGSVVVAFRVAAVVAIHFDFVVLGRVPVVAHEEDDRVLPQSGLFELLYYLSDVVVGRRDKGTVRTARFLDSLVVLQVFFECLLGIMRNVEGGVEEEGFVVTVFCLVVQEAERPIDHEIWEKRVRMKDLGRAFEQVVKSVAVQEKVRVVVDKAVADAEELVEALTLRANVAVSSQVPLSVESGLVAGIPQGFGERNFLKCHKRAFGRHVPLAPGVHAAPLRVSPRHQSRPRRTADRVSVRGRKPHPDFCQAVNVRRVQIGRPVTPGIKRALVVGEEDDDVGLVGGAGETRSGQEDQQDSKVAHWCLRIGHSRRSWAERQPENRVFAMRLCQAEPDLLHWKPLWTADNTVRTEHAVRAAVLIGGLGIGCSVERNS
jgi:hypothetical protein